MFLIEFESADFSTNSTFSSVEEFSFAIDLDTPLQTGSLIDPPLKTIEYKVRGSLMAGTPSGFPAFNLERTLTGTEFYEQGSSLRFEIAPTTNLEDGLQVSELEDTEDPVFIFNGREIDNGRFHPPVLELNSDGTGSIQNSNNIPSVEPPQEVDFGEEYVTELSFDPTEVTLVEPNPSLKFGSLENDRFEGNFTLSSTLLFTGRGEDVVDSSELEVRGNRTYGGSDDDELIANRDDRAFGGSGNDTLDASQGNGNNRIYGGEGNDEFLLGRSDRAIGGNGSDRFFLVTGGDNLLTGGAGEDEFWIVSQQVPTEPNLITDLTSGEDTIGFEDFPELTFEDLSLTQDGTDTILGLEPNAPIARLQGVQADRLSANDFTFTEDETADVEAVAVQGTPGNYSFAVTVSSPDTGCEQYADWWEVITPSGELVERRILLHSHVNEQPFTRSSTAIDISATDTVIVRAHMNDTGYGGQALQGTVSSGFEATDLPADFASELASAPPQPTSCAF